jgi:molecular chaperone HscB
MNLQTDDFELFGVPRRFAQERAVLESRWKELQREAHPDRFSAQGAAAQRVALQWSVRINEAWQRLKDPLRRAAYLCELHGAPVQAESNTAMPPAFLMQQMAWREALEDARAISELDDLAAAVSRARREALQSCERLIDGAGDYAGAVLQVRALMFIERFAAEVDARLDALQDTPPPATALSAKQGQ